MSPLAQARLLVPLLTAIRDRLGAAGSRYACATNASRDTIDSTIRRALNDAREEKA